MKLKELFNPRYDLDRVAMECEHCSSIILGTYLGYPMSIVQEYINRVIRMERLIDQGVPDEEILDHEPFPDSSFIGTGFIPVGRDLNITPERMLRMINRRRYHNKPMTLDVADAELDDNFFDKIVQLINTDKKFHDQCVRNIRKIKSRVPEIRINLEDYRLT